MLSSVLVAALSLVTIDAKQITGLPVEDVRSHGAKCTGSGDDTSAVQAVLAAFHGVLIPDGATCIVSNVTVQLDGTRIVGGGKLKQKTGATGATLSTNDKTCQIDGIEVDGGLSGTMSAVAASPANRIGILVPATSKWVSIRNVRIHGFGNVGLQVAAGGQHTQPTTDLSGVEAYENWHNVEILSEYVISSSMTSYYGRVGLFVGTGNQVLAGGSITDNFIGVQLGNSGNDGHGTIAATMITHNTTSILAVSIINGFVFAGCQIFSGLVDIHNSQGILISGGEVDVTEWDIGGGNRISNNTALNNYGNLIPAFTGTTVYTDNFGVGPLAVNFSVVSDGNLTYAAGKLSDNTPSFIAVTAIPKMTSLTLPSGVASASTTLNGSYPAWQAFDQLGDATFWVSQVPAVFPETLTYHFATGALITPTRYTLSGPYACCAPKDWTFQGSHDGASWTTLDTQTNITFAPAVKQSFNFANTVTWEWYRIRVTDTFTHSDGVYVGEFGVNQVFDASFATLGIGTNAPASTAAVRGNMTIGRTWATTHAADVDGIAVEGNIVAGNSLTVGSLTPFALVTAGASTVLPQTSVALGSSPNVLTSGGAGVSPAFKAPLQNIPYIIESNASAAKHALGITRVHGTPTPRELLVVGWVFGTGAGTYTVQVMDAATATTSYGTTPAYACNAGPTPTSGVGTVALTSTSAIPDGTEVSTIVDCTACTTCGTSINVTAILGGN